MYYFYILLNIGTLAMYIVGILYLPRSSTYVSMYYVGIDV